MKTGQFIKGILKVQEEQKLTIKELLILSCLNNSIKPLNYSSFSPYMCSITYQNYIKKLQKIGALAPSNFATSKERILYRILPKGKEIVSNIEYYSKNL